MRYRPLRPEPCSIIYARFNDIADGLREHHVAGCRRVLFNCLQPLEIVSEDSVNLVLAQGEEACVRVLPEQPELADVALLDSRLLRLAPLEALELDRGVRLLVHDDALFFEAQADFLSADSPLVVQRLGRVTACLGWFSSTRFSASREQSTLSGSSPTGIALSTF